MNIPSLLTTRVACRVVGYDPDRLNEQISAGNFPCAPTTSPGRQRLFNPDAMLALALFVRQLENGTPAKYAGEIACEVASEAKANPENPVIAYIFDWFSHPSGYACVFDRVPSPENWQTGSSEGGHDIRQVLMFNVAKLRDIISHKTAHERSIIGERE